MKLHPADTLVIAAYMIGTLALGSYFSRNQKSIRDYFVGDRDVPWWGIMFSIVATETSSVTFISVPGLAFRGDMTFLQLVFGYMVGRVIIALLLIPLYFRGELYTVYQVLEDRFGNEAKRAAASLFLLTRSLADGLRLLLTAIMLRELTGWSFAASILAIGIVTIIYTYLGGMSAVIWTDTAQLFVYLAGAVLAGQILLGAIPGGWAEYVAVSSAAEKFRVFDFTFDLARDYTFWSGLVGGAFLTMATHGTDQLMVQRYLCARSFGQARAALLGSSAIILAQFVLFLMIGAGLYVYYHHFGIAAPARADYVFPAFIVNNLPAGVVGLVVAAVFAAAMSTLSSSLNSSATTSLTDFYRPLLKPNASQDHYLKTSRWMTAFWGLVQIAVAFIGINFSESIVNQVLAIASFTNGPILGLFLLGALTRSVGQLAALIGFFMGMAVVAAIALMQLISWQWYVLIGAVVTFLSGQVASLLLGRAGREGSQKAAVDISKV
jgi:SSS family solute:Na+ symporter